MKALDIIYYSVIYSACILLVLSVIRLDAEVINLIGILQGGK